MNGKTIGKGLVVLFGALVFISCNKDKNKAQDTIQFNGITATDAIGEYIFFDTTDWRLHDQWTDKEHALLGPPLPAMTNDAISAIVCFPNPSAKQSFIYQIGKTTGTQLQYAIVDRHYKVLLQGLDTGFNTTINTAALGIIDTVRMYYRIVRNDSACYGHGDIAIVKL